MYDELTPEVFASRAGMPRELFRDNICGLSRAMAFGFGPAKQSVELQLVCPKQITTSHTKGFVTFADFIRLD
jgi:hypothetical protein